MKIITWNCNMAFRKKAHLLLKYDPDIVIVPECESPEKLKFDEATRKPTDIIWFGSNPNKGLGIFSYSHFRFKVARDHHIGIKTVVPVIVKGGSYDFNLYAIWANNPGDPDGQYVEQVWKALQYYDKKLKRKKTMLAGDFNSNTIWDKKYRTGNHSHVVERLSKKHITSCYHLHHQQLQGKEKHPTFYLYKHKNKPYHLDYCFASKDMTDRISSVEIGKHRYWMKYSDHVPVIITFNINEIHKPLSK